MRTAFAIVALLTFASCSSEWPAYRYNLFRSAVQVNDSPLAHPSSLGGLHVIHTFHPPAADNPRGFRASPIVYNNKVYIGNANGRLYALSAVDLSFLWMYPPSGHSALLSQFECNFSSMGIASSAVIATVQGQTAAIFAAPDQSIGMGLGSSRLFAINADTGAEIWKSPEIARVTGTTPSSTSELHEQIGYSSPLIFNNHVYVGIANHCDNPIQNGRVVAVNLSDGTIDGGFTFNSTTARGGGIWNAVAAGGLTAADGIFFTTGNARCWNGGCQSEPSTNRSLSLIRVDANTGTPAWNFQPVPFSMDDDPDWSAGVAFTGRDCSGSSGFALSVMKDGWAYSVRLDGTMRWQFPPTGAPFHPGDGTTHGDTDYNQAGAVWGDLFVVMSGGLQTTTDVYDGFNHLHGLNVCEGDSNRVRWIFDAPSPAGSWAPPAITGGVIYAGTASGHLIVFGDPTVLAPAGSRCIDTAMTNAQCTTAGLPLVANPALIKDIALDGAVRGETALVARTGRVYVATMNSTIYEVAP